MGAGVGDRHQESKQKSLLMHHLIKKGYYCIESFEVLNEFVLMKIGNIGLEHINP